MRLFMLMLLSLAAIFAQAQPTTNAPAPPTRNASDVVSIYGEAYSNIGMVNYNPGWGQSGSVDIAFNPGSGNLVMAYTNFNYQGTGFEANPQNASAMEFVHIDIWTSNATVVKFTPIDNSGVGPGEVLVTVPLVNNGWSSVDLPKSAFTGMSWNSIFQLKFDGQGGVSPSNIYMDNIYFWKTASATGTDATLGALQVNGASVPAFTPSAFNYDYGVPGGGAVPQITLATTNDPGATVTTITQASAIPGNATVLVTAANGTTTATYTISYFFNSPANAAPTPTNVNVISLFSDAYTDVPVDTWHTSWSQSVFYADTIVGNPTRKYTNLGFNGVETVATPVNAAGMTYLHLDVWTPNITTLNVKLVSFLGDGFGGPNGDSEGGLNFTPEAGKWNRLHIPLADFTAAGLSSLNDLNQYIFTSTPFGSGVLFLDNVYFTTEVLLSSTQQPGNAVQSVKIYPNPAHSEATVTIDAAVKQVEVYHIDGQLVMMSKQSTLQLQSLKPGMYVVKVMDTEGRILVEKLIVE